MPDDDKAVTPAERDHEIEIFRVGRWKPMGMPTMDFTADDLQRVATEYNPERREVPVVIGHPWDSGVPAVGWVKSLRFAGESLYATLTRLSADFVEAVRSGAYRYRSPAFDFGEDGKPTRLFHLGILGGSPPACEGLPPLAFSAGARVLAFSVDINERKDEPMEIKDQSGLVKAVEAIKNFLSQPITLSAPHPTMADDSARLEFAAMKRERDSLAAELAEAKKQKEKEEQDRKIALAAARIDKLMGDRKAVPAQKDSLNAVAFSLTDEQWAAFSAAMPEIGGLRTLDKRVTPEGKPVSDGESDFENELASGKFTATISEQMGRGKTKEQAIAFCRDTWIAGINHLNQRKDD